MSLIRKILATIILLSFLPTQSFPQGAVLHTREADSLKGILDELQTTKIENGEISLVNPSISLNEWKEAGTTSSDGIFGGVPH